jgi:uncharacterized protein
MNYFDTDSAIRTYVVRLDQGDLLLESIRSLIEKEDIKTGVVVSGIGTLDKLVSHLVTTTGYPPVEFLDTRDALPFELVSLQGVIADGVPHIHLVVSDAKCAYAGHLEDGCRILYLGEVVIQTFNDLHIRRVRDEKGILKLERK